MSMLGRLKELWGYQDRVRQLERSLARCDEGWRISVQKHIEDIRRHRETEAERDKLIAERDATAKQLKETTANLIEAKRRCGDLNEGFDRLAAVFRRNAVDLAAAEDLLDEAGESIRVWRNVAFQVIAELIVEKHCR